MDLDNIESHKRVIIHIDIDCFYAQVEMIKNPELYTKPLGIRQKNIIVTCNYPAREFGVKKLMRVQEAIELCPPLVMVLGEDLTEYQAMSDVIHGFLRNYTNLVEKLGMDENFLDVTELVNDRLKSTNVEELKAVGYVYESDSSPNDCECGCRDRLLLGSVIAQEIRDALKAEVGITCCAGIAHNKLAAKLVAGVNKPNKQTTIFPLSVITLIESLESPRNIPGIGSETARKFSAVNINTIQDLQTCNLNDIKFLKDPLATKKLSFGIDNSAVVPSGPVKQISVEDSFAKCQNIIECEKIVNRLMLSVCEKVIKDGRIPGGVTISIRRDFRDKRESQQRIIPRNVVDNLTKENIDKVKDKLVAIAMPIVINLIGKKGFPITLLAITMSKLKEPDSKNASAITNFFTSIPSSSVASNVNIKETSPTISTPKLSSSSSSGVKRESVTSTTTSPSQKRRKISPMLGDTVTITKFFAKK